MGRPDWLPEAFAYHAVTPETCYGCGGPPRHYVIKKGALPLERRTHFYWWCGKADCEAKAKAAITGKDA